MTRDLLPLLCATLPVAAGALAWARWDGGPLTRRGVEATPDRPIAFAYKCTWLAVQAQSADEVAAALARQGFRAPVPCNWATGVARALGPPSPRDVFVTPPIDGWVFVLGAPLDTERDLAPVAALSAGLGRPVFAFGSHRVASWATWAIAAGGEVTRAWGIADGQVLFDVGAVTPEERALDLSFAEDIEDDERWERASDDDTVVALARAWTRDPSTLGEIEAPSAGILIRRPRR